MNLITVVEAWRHIAATPSRTTKIQTISGLLSGEDPDEAALAAAYLTGQPPQGRIGVGPATVHAMRQVSASPAAQLTLRAVDGALDRIASESGEGSTARRAALLEDLFGRATGDEQDFLVHLLMGELRQGALDGLMVEAIAKAARVAVAEVRRAIMLEGRLHVVARAALAGGSHALAAYGLEMFRPLQPMLAQTADDVADALGRLSLAAFEYKLDGARVQVHRSGNDVRIFTRNLNDVTQSIPDVVETVLALPSRDVILDGEAIALRPDGSPLPFQLTMRRFGRRLDVESLRREIPLCCVFFDCLRNDGVTLIERPYADRWTALESAVMASSTITRTVTDREEEAAAFLERALAVGHEGVVAKSLEAPYDAGSRGGGWLKIKPVHTLDLVVLAAEWGHGRRRGWLSNLHLGARGERGWVMLGKTFKGLTDEVLEWQTRELLAREVAREGHIVHVRPELVVEIAFNDVQASPRYPGGVALRFARVRAYRTDKTPAEADTIQAVRHIHQRQVAGGFAEA